MSPHCCYCHSDLSLEILSSVFLIVHYYFDLLEIESSVFFLMMEVALIVADAVVVVDPSILFFEAVVVASVVAVAAAVVLPSAHEQDYVPYWNFYYSLMISLKNHRVVPIIPLLVLFQ